MRLTLILLRADTVAGEVLRQQVEGVVVITEVSTLSLGEVGELDGGIVLSALEVVSSPRTVFRTDIGRRHDGLLLSRQGIACRLGHDIAVQDVLRIRNLVGAGTDISHIEEALIVTEGLPKRLGNRCAGHVIVVDIAHGEVAVYLRHIRNLELA